MAHRSNRRVTREQDMESLTQSAAQRPRTGAASRRHQLVRRRMLASLRREVGRLHDAGYSTSAIAQILGISSRDARAFCPTPSVDITRVERIRAEAGLRQTLSGRAIKCLLQGKYAALGGATDEARSRALPRIASAYTMAELLEEPGIGYSTATQIEQWLEHLGLNLRLESYEDVISTLRARR